MFGPGGIHLVVQCIEGMAGLGRSPCLSQDPYMTKTITPNSPNLFQQSIFLNYSHKRFYEVYKFFNRRRYQTVRAAKAVK